LLLARGDTRQLNRYINLPPAWEMKSGSGLDWFRIEGFPFGRLDRNLDQIARMVRYPFEELAWPRADVKYLMGHFDPGSPWQRDYLHARPLKSHKSTSGPTTTCAYSIGNSDRRRIQDSFEHRPKTKLCSARWPQKRTLTEPDISRGMEYWPCVNVLSFEIR
jgi:hypothetical protein